MSAMSTHRERREFIERNRAYINGHMSHWLSQETRADGRTPLLLTDGGTGKLTLDTKKLTDAQGRRLYAEIKGRLDAENKRLADEEEADRMFTEEGST